jgi:hypothetical protein
MDVTSSFPFDTSDSLLLRVSLSNPPLFPNLIRLLPISSNKYHVENVTHFVVSKPLSYWNESTKNFLINIYPRLSSKDIGMILLERKRTSNIMSFLETFDHNFFSHNDDPDVLLESYHTQIQRMMDELQVNFKKMEDNYSFLLNTFQVHLSPFVIDQIFVRVYIDSHTFSLKELFDTMKVTENTVMIVLDSFFKVNEFMRNEVLLFLDEDFEEETVNIVIRFPHTFVRVKVNQETITFSLLKKEEKDQQTIMNELKSIFSFNILEADTSSYRGFLTYKISKFNIFVFADFVMNNKNIRKILHLNEFSRLFTRTISEKQREIKTHHLSMSLFSPYLTEVRIGIQYEPDESTLYIRVIDRIDSEINLESIRNTFSRVLFLYSEEEAAIEKEYKSIIPGFTSTRGRYKKKKRIKELRGYYPELFSSGYPTECHKKAHPYPVPLDQLEDKISSLGRDKLLNFPFGSQYWFACDPREPTDVDKGYIYPGIKENNNPDSEFDFIPCCYKENQYEKEGSQLNLYLSSTMKKPKDRHILGPDKMLLEGRYGRLPFSLQSLSGFAKFQTFKRGIQVDIPNRLRFCPYYGIGSFIHCLQLAKNPKSYLELNREQREEKVFQVRQSLSSLEHFNMTKSETFDLTDSQIRKILIDPKVDVDPRLFVVLFEMYYKVDIYLFKVDEEMNLGNVMFPRYSKFYLSRERRRKSSVILILFQDNGTWNIEVVCELQVLRGKLTGNTFFSFSNSDPFVQYIRFVTETSHNLFVKDNSHFKRISPKY